MILRQDEPSCLSLHPIQRARSRWGVYRESGLVHGSAAVVVRMLSYPVWLPGWRPGHYNLSLA
jgi:hypothetical protein